jgi:hypothetical protein
VAVAGLVVAHQSICELWWLRFGAVLEKGVDIMLNGIALDWAAGSILTRDVDDIEGKEAWRPATIAHLVDELSS